MNKLTDWIIKHQIGAFFIITFMITGGLGFSYGAIMNKGNELLIPLAFIATCGPALAGIIVTAVSNAQPRQGTRKTFWAAFFTAWVVSTLVFLANNIFINQAPFSIGMVIFVFIAVAPVAFVISMAFSRIPAVKRYVSSLIRLRGVWGWVLLALVFYPVLILLSISVGSLLEQQPVAAYQSPIPETGPALIGPIAITFLYQFFFFNATGEEVGWRGFALLRLQTRTSPLIASLILACFWVPWHSFLWLSQGAAVTTWDFWMKNGSMIILSSIITAWFYNRSRGSILVAGIVHAADNTSARLLLIQDWYIYLLLLKAIVALALILLDRMWKKLPPDHPAVYIPP